MGSSYQFAFFTIVQGSTSPSTVANSPMPGIRPSSRQVLQTSQLMQGKHVVLTLRPPFSMSAWEANAIWKGFVKRRRGEDKPCAPALAELLALLTRKGRSLLECTSPCHQLGTRAVVSGQKSFQFMLRIAHRFNLSGSIPPRDRSGAAA